MLQGVDVLGVDPPEQLMTLLTNERKVLILLTNQRRVSTVLTNERRVSTVLTNERRVSTVLTNERRVLTVLTHERQRRVSTLLPEQPPLMEQTEELVCGCWSQGGGEQLSDEAMEHSTVCTSVQNRL